MSETDRQKQARALCEGAKVILGELPVSFHYGAPAEEILPARELLNMAILLLDGKYEAREAKNARDRERRAAKKAKPASRPRKAVRSTAAAASLSGLDD